MSPARKLRWAVRLAALAGGFSVWALEQFRAGGTEMGIGLAAVALIAAVAAGWFAVFVEFALNRGDAPDA